jgi:type IV secretory pathway TraG/TraD family ATPase VirD4
LEGLGAARDKGVHLVLAHQSLGDLKDCTKDLNPEAVVDAVVENCRIKICYAVQSPDTAAWLAEMSGTILVDDESRTVHRNITHAETVSNERTIRQAERFLIDANMLRNLHPQTSAIYGVGLPQFVSIQPIKAEKDPRAIQVLTQKSVKVESTASGVASLDALS